MALHRHPAGQDFHRGKFEAARRKLHRQLRDAWSRASRLTEEIHRTSGGFSPQRDDVSTLRGS